MKNGVLNAYNLHKKTIFFKKYEKTFLIFKFFTKTKKISERSKLKVLFKRWAVKKMYSTSNQTAVCRRGGGFKRVINIVGFNRHMMRQHLNVKKLPVLKKLSW